MAEALETAKEEARQLAEKKTQLERQLAGLEMVLETQRVGMDDPLTDAEGFPRSDIDVYLVRTTRTQIVRLRNDFYATMDAMQKKLEEVHALHRQLGPAAPPVAR